MPQINVKSSWVSGNLVFSDKSGNIIATWDGTNRKLSFPSGSTLEVNSNSIDAASAALVLSQNGLGRMGVARFSFDPSGDALKRPVAAYGTGVILPSNAVVIGGFVEVNTAFTSAGANDGTIAISVQGANDIITATAVSGAPYSTIGLKAITPKSNTPEGTGIKCTAAREITCTVAVDALTAGKLTGFLHYVVSAVSA